MHVLLSSSLDVYENLALEDVLLDDEAQELPLVLIYRNGPSVVLGKNQNPWRECAAGRLEAMGVKLARRVSGGGTVFHDEGNMNVSCFLARETYSRCEVLRQYVSGLRQLGLPVSIAGETSLVVPEGKISGQAFCFRRNRVLHHGTLLWSADLDILHAALAPALDGIITRAIPSVRMPVVNLCGLLPGRTPEQVADAVVAALSVWAGGEVSRTRVEPAAIAGVRDRAQAMRRAAWIYGTTPDFEWRLGGEDPGAWTLFMHRGVITRVDGADTVTASRLNGRPFTRDCLIETLERVGGAGATDKLNWLLAHPF